LSGVHTDFLDEVGGFLDDFVKSGLGPFGGIHLVDSDDELFDTQSVGQEGVFTSLTILGDTSFEFTDTSSNND
jgi:hypothetical protein